MLWSAIHGYSHMIATAALSNQDIVNARGPDGVTPLVLACQHGQLDTINSLLELVRGACTHVSCFSTEPNAAGVLGASTRART